MDRRSRERDAERAAEEIADDIRRSADWKHVGGLDYKVGD